MTVTFDKKEEQLGGLADRLADDVHNRGWKYEYGRSFGLKVEVPAETESKARLMLEKIMSRLSR